MERGPKDILKSLGVISAIVALWQFREYLKDKEKGAADAAQLKAALARIESKLK